ncbi:MAG: lamin tail domain-containing protein, partial [Deltaproteobacteria bacterium]|nr:lamin tail domain-containing protein [Deltaproteobacteria bacterium]
MKRQGNRVPLFFALSVFIIGGAFESAAQPIFSNKLNINEIMINPKKIDDGIGEWFELLNASGVEINLQGMVLTDFVDDFHIISPLKPFFIQPGEFLVFGRSGFQEKNGGVKVNYAYGPDINLDNESDMLALLFGTEIIDIFVYSSDVFQINEGFSLNLEPLDILSPIAVVNKIWCAAWKNYDETADNFGTPGAPNTYCDNDEDNQSEDQGDCDDDDPAVFSGAVEKCNGIDDDCNGVVDDISSYEYFICYGEGVCGAVKPVCKGEMGWICPVAPEYEEIEKTCDGLDNDCDGETDEGLSAPE